MQEATAADRASENFARRRSWSGILLAVSNFGNFAFPLIRGIFLARLLPPIEFGLAVSITIVASVVELVTDVGLAQFALRVGDDATPTLHSLAIVRSAMLGIAVAAGGPIFAYLLHEPGTAWIYTMVGFSCFCRGFSHLGIKTAMRTYNFVPEAVTDIVTHIVWTATSIVAALLLRDYRSMVIGIMAYTLAYVIISHLLATTKWTLGWNKLIVRESVSFGKHLIPNGIALAVLNTGERAVIGSRLGLESLARYSALSTSAFTPRAAIIRFLTSLITPQFVNAANQAEADKLLVIWMSLLSGTASLFAFGYMAIGQPVLAFVFGRFYGASQSIIGLIAILSAIRYMAALTTPPSIARGNTQLVFIATASAAGGIGVGLAFITVNHTIEAMVLGMCVGEFLSLIYTTRKLLKFHGSVQAFVWILILQVLILVISCDLIIFSGYCLDPLAKIELCACFALCELILLSFSMSLAKLSLKHFFGVLLPVRA